MPRYIACLVIAAFTAACDDFPRDPQSTLEKVRGGVMRVGISHNPPWTIVSGERFGGLEARLVKDIARELGAKVEWVHGAETELLQALERLDLDLVIAGLTSETPWSGRIALTGPYVKTALLVGVPPGSAAGGYNLYGREVAVPPGDAVAELVRDAGGEPVPTADLPAPGKAVAAEDWQIAAWDFVPTSIVLKQVDHVIAAPPGENGWLVYVERSLYKREAELMAALLTDKMP